MPFIIIVLGFDTRSTRAAYRCRVIGIQKRHLLEPAISDMFSIIDEINQTWKAIRNSHCDIDSDNVSVGNFQRAEAQKIIIKSGYERGKATHQGRDRHKISS